MKTINKKILLTLAFCLFGLIFAANAQDAKNLINSTQTQQPIVQSTAATEVPTVQSEQMTLKPQMSPIETLFGDDIKTTEDKTKQLELKQIGYDIFQNALAQGFGKYDGSYKLNIGEKVDVYSWGDSIDMLSISGAPLLSPLTKSQIDGKGNLFVPGIGMVKADGKSISQVENEIQSLASKKFTNAKVKITVADSNDFTVYVYGYVNKPGKVAVNNNSSIIEALAAAGGVTKNGSLRNISYKSDGKTKNVDLYKVIFSGQDSNVRLKPNDTVFVNKLGSVVAIKNGVKIPGIYETTTYDNLDELINYAGGFMPSTDKTIVDIKAYSTANGQRISMDIPSSLFGKTKPANGDILEFRTLFGQAEDFVTLMGNVKHPATYEYKKGMKLSDILKNKNELQNETLVYQAVIKRISGDGKEISSIPVSLQDFFNGGNNPELRPQDIITVYKNTNSQFIEVYGCIDNPKRVPYTDTLTLKNVMADIQFIASSNADPNIHDVANKITSNNVIIPASDVAVEITNDNNTEIGTKTLYLYDLMIQDDIIQDVKITQGDKILFRPLREDEIVKTVKISGYVNKPGVYKFVEGKKLSDVISEAGGLTPNSNLRGIVLKRTVVAQREKEAILAKNALDIKQIEGQMAGDTNASKEDIEARQLTMKNIQNETSISKNTGRISLNIKGYSLKDIDYSQNLEIQDGDDIYIPKFSNHVMVMGEVYNETSFVYKKGERASYYIQMVGGYTPNARRTKLYKIGVNGQAKRLRITHADNIEPGDTIIVPKKLRGNDWITPLASTLQSIAAMLTSVFVVTKL